MKKLVVIINGKGGVGKDTLCDFAKKMYKVKNISAITPIKEIAYANGWNGEKNAKSRKFLADLKQLFVEYNDLPVQYLLSQYHEFLKSKENILFVHIREGEEIDKFKKEIEIPCITLLITRDMPGNELWGNSADDNVEQYQYDYVYNNEGNLKETETRFCQYIKDIFQREAYEVQRKTYKLRFRRTMNIEKRRTRKFEWRSKSRA